MDYLDKMTIMDALIYNILGLELIINDGKVIGLVAAEEDENGNR